MINVRRDDDGTWGIIRRKRYGHAIRKKVSICVMDGDGITIYGVMKSHLLRFRGIYSAINLQRQSRGKQQKQNKFLLVIPFA